jgi:tetratricopeptide (TPR) repeat protein
MEEYEQYIKNGDAFVKKEKSMDAIREYTKAYDMIAQDDIKAEVCYKLSQCYSSLDHKSTENPIKYAEESLELHHKLGDSELEIMDMVNIGYIYLDSGKRDDAILNFNKAIEASDAIKDVVLFALTNNAKAEALSSLKSKQAESMKIYDNVLELTEKSEDWENYFEALYGKINILRDSDINTAFDAGKKGLDKIDSVMETIKTKKDKKEFKDSVSYLYDSVSDIAMELENIDEAMKIASRSKE